MVIKLDKLCVWIFIVSITTMLPSIVFVKFIDELGCYALAGVAFLDMVFNRNIKKYTLLFVFVAIMMFYVIYSLTIVHFNTSQYVLTDAIIELKPFLPFLVIYAIAPQFTHFEKKTVKILCIINVVVCLAVFAMGGYVLEKLVGHVAYIGSCCLICASSYLLMSITEDGMISRKDIIFIVMMLIAGLTSTRSKYYGEFVLALFFLFLYKPGMMKGFNIKHVALMLGVLALVVAVGWSKFSYYFITGNSDTFDPTVAQSYARPVLYATGGLILIDFFPFGSGLASFASYASAEHYSTLYYDYGINNIWGLSEDYSDFICDAYYPCIAQFGIVGLVLFIAFFRWVYRRLRNIVRTDAIKYKFPFVVGVLGICFILIESVGGTLFVQTSGMIAMMLIGMAASTTKHNTTQEIAVINET